MALNPLPLDVSLHPNSDFFEDSGVWGHERLRSSMPRRPIVTGPSCRLVDTSESLRWLSMLRYLTPLSEFSQAPQHASAVPLCLTNRRKCNLRAIQREKDPVYRPRCCCLSPSRRRSIPRCTWTRCASKWPAQPKLEHTAGPLGHRRRSLQ